MANKFNFAEVKRKIELTKKQLPAILAKETEKAFVENFYQGGFFGKKWQVPQRRVPGTNAYKYPKKGGFSRRTKPTLTMTGRLRQAVNTSTRVKTFELIKLVVDLKYAARHNDGLDGMPKRQFMGEHPELTKKQKAIITKFFDKVWA
jgi:phage gpG-like protein